MQVKNLKFYLIALVFVQVCEAQNYIPSDNLPPLNNGVWVGFRQSFHGQDYLLGGEIGWVNPRRPLAVYLSYDGRPFRKKTEVERSPNLIYQYAESRQLIGAGAEWHYYFSKKIGVFINGTWAYSWGDFKGSARGARRSFTLVPRMGWVWQVQPVFWIKGGYEFLDPLNDQVSPHRFHIGFSVAIADSYQRIR